MHRRWAHPRAVQERRWALLGFAGSRARLRPPSLEERLLKVAPELLGDPLAPSKAMPARQEMLAMQAESALALSPLPWLARELNKQHVRHSAAD